MLEQAILDYASAWVAYQSGTNYGQMGGAPTPDGLNHQQALLVRSVAGCGRRAGQAQRQHDAGRVAMERQAIRMTRCAWGQAGLPAAALDACYRVGYTNG